MGRKARGYSGDNHNHCYEGLVMSNLKTRLKRLESIKGQKTHDIVVVLNQSSDGRLIDSDGNTWTDEQADRFEGLVIVLSKDDA